MNIEKVAKELIQKAKTDKAKLERSKTQKTLECPVENEKHLIDIKDHIKELERRVQLLEDLYDQEDTDDQDTTEDSDWLEEE